ncbi:MAG: hypothetical protein ABSG17_03285 [Spirochaetia bacterium]|jgi:hypothetical protein
MTVISAKDEMAILIAELIAAAGLSQKESRGKWPTLYPGRMEDGLGMEIVSST